MKNSNINERLKNIVPIMFDEKMPEKNIDMIIKRTGIVTRLIRK